MQLYSRLKKVLTSILFLPGSLRHKIRRSCSGEPECTQMCEECPSMSAARSQRCMMRKRRIRRLILIFVVILLLISFLPIPLSSDESLNVWQLVVQLLLSLA